MSSPYEIYVEKYGIIASGGIVGRQSDFIERRLTIAGGDREYTAEEKIAVTLAISDNKNGWSMRTQSKFKSEVERLLS